MILEVSESERRNGYQLFWNVDYAKFRGNYRIKNSNLLIIDRFRTAKRLITNLTVNKKKYMDKLCGFLKYNHRYLLMDFSLDELLEYKGEGVNGLDLLDILENEFEKIFSVKVLFCDTKENAQKRLADILLNCAIDLALNIPTGNPIKKLELSSYNNYYLDYRPSQQASRNRMTL